MRVVFAHPLWLQFASSEHVQAYSAYVRTVFTLFCSHAVPQAHSLRQRAIPAWRQGPKYEGVVCPTLMQGQAVRACSQLKPLNCRASWSTSFCSSPVAAIRILKTCTSILHIRTLSCFHAVLLACRTPSILRQLAIPVCPTLMQGHVPTRQC